MYNLRAEKPIYFNPTRWAHPHVMRMIGRLSNHYQSEPGIMLVSVQLAIQAFLYNLNIDLQQKNAIKITPYEMDILF